MGQFEGWWCFPPVEGWWWSAPGSTSASSPRAIETTKTRHCLSGSDHPLANALAIEEVWVEPARGQVAIYYRDSCIEIIQALWWVPGGERADVEKTFRAIARESKVDFSVGSVFVRKLGRRVFTLEAPATRGRTSTLDSVRFPWWWTTTTSRSTGITTSRRCGR